MKHAKQKWNKGDILKIPVKDKGWSFGRVLKRPLIAFYGIMTSEDSIPSLDLIISSPVIFKVWVMHYAVTSGDWPIIGNIPLKPELEVPPIFFKRDPISSELSIYMGDGSEKPATLKECLGLECAAVWNPEHIVDRLDDHFSGKSNKWVEIMKPKMNSTRQT